MNAHRPHRAQSAAVVAVLVVLGAGPAAAAVEARVALDRSVLEWRQEHTLSLLVDFVRPGEPIACGPVVAATMAEPSPARARDVRIGLAPAPVLREVDAPGFPAMHRGVHDAVYAGAASAVLLRLRVAPASTGEFDLGRLRISYTDPDSGETQVIEQNLTVTMQLDAETARKAYEQDLAATDFEQLGEGASGESMVTADEDDTAAAAEDAATVSLPPPIPEPDPRVTAQAERIMAAFARGGRRPGNPADDVSFAACVRKRPFLVALDPGHAPTGESQGRAGRKAMESEFNDRIAAVLAEKLEGNFGLGTTLSREGPEVLSMRERVARLNEARPTLVVSLHHDNVSPKRQRTRRVADEVVRTCREYEGFSIYARADGGEGVGSSVAADFIADELLAAGRPIGRFFELGDPTTGVYDGSGLALLNGMRQPAVLIEIGYLCNPRERTILERERFVQAQARLIANGIRRYVANTHCAPGGT